MSKSVEDIYAKENEKEPGLDFYELEEAIEYYKEAAGIESPMQNHYRQLWNWLVELTQLREDAEQQYQDWLDEQERDWGDDW